MHPLDVIDRDITKSAILSRGKSVGRRLLYGKKGMKYIKETKEHLRNAAKHMGLFREAKKTRGMGIFGLSSRQAARNSRNAARVSRKASKDIARARTLIGGTAVAGGGIGAHDILEERRKKR